jgi:hypothetical protein
MRNNQSYNHTISFLEFGKYVKCMCSLSLDSSFMDIQGTTFLSSSGIQYVIGSYEKVPIE